VAVPVWRVTAGVPRPTEIASIPVASSPGISNVPIARSALGACDGDQTSDIAPPYVTVQSAEA